MKKFISIGLAVVFVIAGYFLLRGSEVEQLEDKTTSYTDISYGFTFNYPSHYYAETKEVGSGERRHTVILIYEDTDENRLVREGKAPGREGPVAVTVEIFQNDLDDLTVENWIRNTSSSNYKLGDGKLSPITLAGKEGLSYTWSGLYEGLSSVIAHDKDIYMISVSTLNINDPIVEVYPIVIDSFTFTK